MRFDVQFIKYRGESVVVDFSIAHLANDPTDATVYADPVFLLLDGSNKILVNTTDTISNSNNQYLGYTYHGVTINDNQAFSNYNFIVKQAVSLLSKESSNYILDIYFQHLVHTDYTIIKRIVMTFDSSYTFSQ
jgi:hypothetical protein